MLQALLADRFKLVVHTDTKPLPAFVLSVGKGKPKLKEADGSALTRMQVHHRDSEPARSLGAMAAVSATPQRGPVAIMLLPTYIYTAHDHGGVRGRNAHDAAARTWAASSWIRLASKGAWDFNFKYTPDCGARCSPAATRGRRRSHLRRRR